MPDEKENFPSLENHVCVVELGLLDSSMLDSLADALYRDLSRFLCAVDSGQLVLRNPDAKVRYEARVRSALANIEAEKAQRAAFAAARRLERARLSPVERSRQALRRSEQRLLDAIARKADVDTVCRLSRSHDLLRAALARAEEAEKGGAK